MQIGMQVYLLANPTSTVFYSCKCTEGIVSFRLTAIMANKYDDDDVTNCDYMMSK